MGRTWQVREGANIGVGGECYPTKISSNEMSTSSEEDLLELEVEIAYKYYRTVTDNNFPEGLGHNAFSTFSEAGSLDSL